MATPITPTITIYNALRRIGMEDADAQSTATAIAVRDDLASKLDLERSIAGVNERFATLTLDIQSNFANVTAEFAAVRADISTATAQTASVRQLIGLTSTFLFTAIGATIGLLIKLVFFP